MPGFQLPWLRMPWVGRPQQASPYETVRAMTGIKPANTVLIVGASDGRLAADVALVTGLNGRTLVVDAAPSAQAVIDAAAAEAGALVEFLTAPADAVPLESESFDVVIVLAASLPAPDPPAAAFAEAARLTRPAGRVLVIEHIRRPRSRAAGSSAQIPPLAADFVCGLLQHAGLRAARLLADVEGLRFYEGIKPRR